MIGDEIYSHMSRVAGACLFASGSPMPNWNDFKPSHASNMYIFPGVGLACILGKFKTVPSALFYIAAKTLAGLVSQKERKYDIHVTEKGKSHTESVCWERSTSIHGDSQ